MRGDRHAIAALAFVALALAGGAAAADEVAIRAAVHDGFGRVAFEWPDPVAYEARVGDATLTIRFARPLQGKAELLSRGLPDYVASAALENDGKTLVARLKRTVTISAFTVKAKTVVVDLTPVAPHKAAPKPAPPKIEAKPAPPKVNVTAAGKDGVVRVTFEWPRRVEYRLVEKDGVGRLSFRAAGTIDEAVLATQLPDLAPKIEAADRATTVMLAIAPSTHLKASRVGKAVVLEVRRPPPSVPPTPEQAPPPTAVAAAAAAPPASITPPADAAPAPESDAAPAAPLPPPASVTVHFAASDNSASLRFDWPVATQAAVFRSGADIWIVFATPTSLDLAEPLARGQQALSAMAQVAVKDATALRVVPRAGLAPSVRRAGSAWIVDLKPQSSPPDAPIVVEPHPVAVPATVTFRVHQAAPPVRLADPVIGTLLVVPVGELGRGTDAPAELVDFRALATVQGIVLRPFADDVALHVTDDAVEVTRPGGLELSSDRDRLLGHRAKTAHTLFDFERWRGSRTLDYAKRRAALERAITVAPQGARSEPRLALAHFYFAHFFAAETLAVLDAVARDDPPFLGEPSVHALKGAACLLVEELKCAADELGQRALDSEPEAALWRASLATAKGDQEGAARSFLDSVSLLPIYPKQLRSRFALEAANAMLETGRPTLAGPLLDLVLKETSAPRDVAMALYLDGRRLQQAGRLDDALKRWAEVAATNDRPAQARALFARAMALLDAGRANRAETVKALDALRFLWRGGDFEFTLLRKLGELQLAEGNEGAALEALRGAATDFPDNRAAKDVAKETGDAFAAFFLGDKGNDLPPLKALALYDQFHDLEPVGERRDRIAKKLIDRLVSVDLLDRAAGLLEEQVAKRMTGADKARGATQLALLRLMDHEPDAAMKALDIDVGRDVTPDLARQRQQLRARVLMELNRPADALALIANDDSRDADRLRADIHWRGHDWKEAAKTLARLAGSPPSSGKIDAEAGRMVVSLAAALTLDDDQAGLAKLRAAFGPAMAGSRFADAFRVLAGDGSTAPGTDPQALASRVAQIGELQNFMAAYKEKVASAGKAGKVN
jgi:hypothetical protein